MNPPDDLLPLSQARKVIQETKETIHKYSFRFSNERELQEGLSQVLGPGWAREHRLSDDDRADFFHEESGVVIEAKIDHGLTPLTRQIHRYLQHKEVTGVLVVTSKMSLGRMPPTISGKPVSIATLIGSIL